MKFLIGIDIGGTKCAVTLGVEDSGNIQIIEKRKIATPDKPYEALEAIQKLINSIKKDYPNKKIEAVGISCGGPLNTQKGLIQSPPNLPGWEDIPVVRFFEEINEVPVVLQNDANACALAEWLWGAGKGTKNMIFLTFGTGMGAGLVLDGKLYSGTNDMAGEVGHIRLQNDGPEGYHKRGSFEGFCSGGGIQRDAIFKIETWINAGKHTSIMDFIKQPQEITTEIIGKCAQEGDKLALSILEDTGKMLGLGLSILIDILNPEKIVIGSIFLRQEDILRGPMEEVIQKEALSNTRKVCQVVSAQLGEELGDYAALSLAANLSEEKRSQFKIEKR